MARPLARGNLPVFEPTCVDRDPTASAPALVSWRRDYGVVVDTDPVVAWVAAAWIVGTAAGVAVVVEAAACWDIPHWLELQHSTKDS